jgi:hypothetical protein
MPQDFTGAVNDQMMSKMNADLDGGLLLVSNAQENVI